MDLYHADIKLPTGFRLPPRTVRLTWSKHAERARMTDRYGMIPKSATVDLSKCRTIEVGMEAGRVKKVVVRTSLDQKNDVIYVLIPGPSAWLVKTVWINEKNDKHKTLDRSKYVC